jgi:hypothetical protein
LSEIRFLLTSALCAKFRIRLCFSSSSTFPYKARFFEPDNRGALAEVFGPEIYQQLLWLPNCVSAARSGALDILITPSKGEYNSKIKRIAPDTAIPETNKAASIGMDMPVDSCS